MFSVAALICSLLSGDCINWIGPDVLDTGRQCEFVRQSVQDEGDANLYLVVTTKCINWGSNA
jgi:hypothetical protein